MSFISTDLLLFYPIFHIELFFVRCKCIADCVMDLSAEERNKSFALLASTATY